MKTSALNFKLPAELIAQHPIRPRDCSRLLVIHKDSGVIEHRKFHEIGKYLVPGDIIILNNTRVLPYRLIMQRLTGGRVEMLLIKRIGNDIWEVMLSSNRRLNLGEVPPSGEGNRGGRGTGQATSNGRSSSRTIKGWERLKSQIHNS